MEGGAEPNPKGQALFALVVCRAGRLGRAGLGRARLQARRLRFSVKGLHRFYVADVSLGFVDDARPDLVVSSFVRTSFPDHLDRARNAVQLAPGGKLWRPTLAKAAKTQKIQSKTHLRH